MRNILNHSSKGLDRESQRVLKELQGDNASTDTQPDGDTQAGEDMQEVQDDDHDPEYEDLPESLAGNEAFVGALHDIVHSRYVSGLMFVVSAI